MFCAKNQLIRALSVGASLLAKIVNDNAGNQPASGVLRFFASKLAPTGGYEPFFEAKKRPEPVGA
ncbi:hypothetical protein DK871_04100 [Pseudomonas sp. L13]|nr:hypothetical protein [Pseudomonas sp. L13]